MLAQAVGGHITCLIIISSFRSAATSKTAMCFCTPESDSSKQQSSES